MIICCRAKEPFECEQNVLLENYFYIGSGFRCCLLKSSSLNWEDGDKTMQNACFKMALKPPRGDSYWCDFVFRYFQDITYRYTLRILNHSAPLRDDLYRTFTYLIVFFQIWGCLSVEDLCFCFGQLPYSKCWIRLSPKLQLAAWSLRPRIMSLCRGSCFLWSVTLLREWKKLMGLQLSHEKKLVVLVI